MGRRRHGGRAQVKVNVSTFVPKVMTPFQWDGQDTTLQIEAKVGALRREMHGKGLVLSWNAATSSILEAAFGRGDRRLGAVIRWAWAKGARFDAWDEHFDYSIWLEAFAQAGLDPAWYGQRDIPTDETLPWSHLGAGVSTAFPLRDRERGLAAKTTSDCHWGPCANCGVPGATGFACDTGEEGPRRLLVEVGGEGRGRRYVGPPGDARRLEGVALDSAGDNVEAGRGERRGWPYDLLGSGRGRGGGEAWTSPMVLPSASK